ncbi:MAG: hypothetical protein ABF991_00020 [Liquorilactobacillus hordei]|uniref:hypothetical protein n=1 Tax=Liquorilactobacillus hordei TaxID=468911 RepID=UPI0039E7DE75
MYEISDNFGGYPEQLSRNRLIEFAKIVCPFSFINSTFEAINELQQAGYYVSRIDLLY